MARLKSGHIVNAAMRLADQSHIPFYVMKKGDADSGVLFIEIENSAMTSTLYTRMINLDGVYEYLPISGDEPRDRLEVAALIEREMQRDSDCWVISIEGQKGLQIFQQIT